MYPYLGVALGLFRSHQFCVIEYRAQDLVQSLPKAFATRLMTISIDLEPFTPQHKASIISTKYLVIDDFDRTFDQTSSRIALSCHSTQSPSSSGPPSLSSARDMLSKR